MRIHQLNRWVYVRLWALLLAAVILVSGCATIEDYKNDKVKFDLQNQRNNDLVRQYSKDISELEARKMAYEKTLANEARFKDENTRLRLRIATMETELKGRYSTFKELGEIITAQTYELVLKDMDDYNNLENYYNRQLKALSSYQDGSPEYIMEADIVRALALLDVISEAIVTINIPREALRESTPADDPKLEPALATLANAQNQMIIALNDFKLRGRDQSNSKYSIAQSSCGNMLAVIADFAASQDDSSPLAKDLIMRLKTMHTVIKVTNILLTTINNSSMPLGKRLLVAQSLKDYQPIAQQLSYLIPMRDINAVGMGQPTNSAIRIPNRMEWILTISTYCQGDAFKPETYLQMRLKEIKPLKAAAIEIIESYKLAHAQP